MAGAAVLRHRLATRLREDALRADGREVVRWIWSELSPFDGVARRIRAAFARGGC